MAKAAEAEAPAEEMKSLGDEVRVGPVRACDRGAHLVPKRRRHHLVGVQKQDPRSPELQSVQRPLALLGVSPAVRKLNHFGAETLRDGDGAVRRPRVHDDDAGRRAKSFEATPDVRSLVLRGDEHRDRQGVVGDGSRDIKPPPRAARRTEPGGMQPRSR